MGQVASPLKLKTLNDSPYNRLVELQKSMLLSLTIIVKEVLMGTCTGIVYVDSTNQTHLSRLWRVLENLTLPSPHRKQRSPKRTNITFLIIKGSTELEADMGSRQPPISIIVLNYH